VIGKAYEFDKVYYSFVYATMLGFIQGAALAQASGFSTDAYTSIVLERIPNVSENFKKFGEQIANRNHDGDQASLTVWGDAYAKSLELCRALEVDDTLPAALMQNFEKAKSEGYGDSEITAIFEVLLPKTTSAS
jgi:3-hydroxyisobutyrate dehydrogenase-like beta-hydroxyacid dehydrogenase